MSELKPRITENGIDYILVGDYYIPDLKLPEEHRPIGKYGRMHREYLREVHPARFSTLVLNGELWTYLAAGIETDGARESLAICFHELFLMGIQYENILVYNLELILSKDYQRTYSSYVTTPFMLTRLLTFEELNQFDAVFVSGGDVSVLCREMSRTGFDRILNNAIKNGLIYVGISAGSMYAAGNLTDGLHIIDNPIIPHWNGSETTVLPNGKDEIKLADGKAVYVEDNYMSVI